MPALLIFTTHPDKDGEGPAFGGTPGSFISRAALEQALAHMLTVTQQFPGEKMLFYPGYVNWNDRWDISLYRKRLQQGNSLGARMAAAFEESIAEGHKAAILVGVNAGDPSLEMLLAAAEGLATADVVIGPTKANGICLLGIRGEFPAGLEQVDWEVENTPAQVLAATDGTSLTRLILPAGN